MKSMKRSIVISRHKTSVSLEDEFWKALQEIAAIKGMTSSALVDSIDQQRQKGNLSSHIRLFVLEYYRTQTANRNKGVQTTSGGN
jgi:predicted DNA-binding ribbon-helix-helix protein